MLAASHTLPAQKRKRKRAGDDLEDVYMQRLAREEAKEEAARSKNRRTDVTTKSKIQKLFATEDDKTNSDSVDIVTGDNENDNLADVPPHESLGQSKVETDMDKASRTVFLGNVSTAAIKSKQDKRILKEHMSSFLSALPKEQASHGIESLRFRSTAFSSSSVPKKAAFATKELMDSTTQSTNAYIVYTTGLAAREATKRLNGSVVLGRHLRVDSVAHPAKTDHRRCVFVGNLGFVDDESAINAAADEADNKRPRKGKEPADAEEGLWMQFSKAGRVENVRVVRDKTTRVGKGFGYVQFEDPNGVEKALLFDGKKFPPLLPRILRVTRAKNISKTSNRQSTPRSVGKNVRAEFRPDENGPQIPSEIQSLTGRAGKLLGRAGAAQVRQSSKGHRTPLRSPETIVFEGYRASSRQGKGTLKLGGPGRKQGKPRTRSSKRGAAFKAAGKKKQG